MRVAPTLAVLVTAAGATGLVLAQSLTRRPTLHEDLPALTGDKAQPTIGHAAPGANPSAISAGDKTLVKPSLDTRPSTPSEPVLGTSDFAADRQTSMQPDDNTGPDGTLQYVSVFNPDVLPFKRMTCFDAVAEDYTLHVERTALTEVPVGGTTDPKTRDRFWGDVLIQLRPGVDVPLPSVAPDMRILSYEVKPKIKLQFSKDGADNFYVRSDESAASGQYRLVFYADADAGYFAPSLPPRAFRVRDVIANTPPELKPQVPDNVRREARITLAKLGIDESYDLGVAFNRLVAHFRAFQAGEIANPTGNIYRDLCDSQAGVCRHRSFAFAVTANALGIPTRYVQNEAHAFVEVWFPIRGWQRIDLGGAALRMNVSGADNKTLHRPRADDPFYKPPEYKNQYTQLEGEIRGLTDQQKADKKKGLDEAPPSGAIGQQGTGQDGSDPSAPNGSDGSDDAGDPAAPDRITPDPTLPATTPDPKKATPELLVTSSDTSAFRGDFIHVEGVVRVGGKGLGNHRVDVFLAPAGNRGKGSIALGPAVTRPDGGFAADLPVPASLDLASYEILLSSAEDAYYNAALSD
jgi:transglutaminase-like putative cysteine protease